MYLVRGEYVCFLGWVVLSRLIFIYLFGGQLAGPLCFREAEAILLGTCLFRLLLDVWLQASDFRLDLT